MMFTPSIKDPIDVAINLSMVKLDQYLKINKQIEYQESKENMSLELGTSNEPLLSNISFLYKMNV